MNNTSTSSTGLAQESEITIADLNELHNASGAGWSEDREELEPPFGGPGKRARSSTRDLTIGSGN